MTSTPSNPNASSIDADRETLCALFDGELQGDAARFAHRRLGHDPEWRAAFGRWQLAGDVMRRQSGGLAPSGFAARVAAELEADQDLAALPHAVGSDLGDARSRWRRGWIPGAALAASVAVAALFVARPLGQADAPAGFDGSPQVADREAGPAPTTAPSQPAPATPSGADATEAGLATAAAAVAVADAPRRAARQRQALRESGADASRMAVSSEAAAPQTLVASEADPVPNPFTPQAVPAEAPVQSRPWPRAVLPGYGTREGYAVGYDAGTSPSPSFYPFEPSLQQPPVQDAPSGEPVPEEALPDPGVPGPH